jgi:hypothetical protein
MTTRRRRPGSQLFRRIERDVYKADRTSLDIAAAMRGPAPLARRLVRRSATRAVFRLFR